MKLIILDHLRRWWPVWVAAGVCNCFITGSFSHADQHLSFMAISFQVFFWLGAYELTFDLQRGCGRILTTLPISSQQIGRAWWTFSVALPTLFLTACSGMTMLVQSAGTAKEFSLNQFLALNITNGLYLGGIFYFFIGSLPGRPQTFTALVRMLIGIGFIGGMLFVKPTLDTIQGIILLLVASVMTVTGWFQAEQMVLQRASFRQVAKASNQNSTTHDSRLRFGGLSYLALRSILQSTLIGVALISIMLLFMGFQSGEKNRPGAISMMIQSGSTPYLFYILMFSIVPVVYQLRFLRTLPIPSLKLATIITILPVFPLVPAGAIIAVTASLISGENLMLPTANSFLLLAAKSTIITFVVVWRGLDILTYFIIFLVAIADIYVTLGLDLYFHLGSQTSEHPLWINVIILISCAFISLIMTRKLLINSSGAYRVRKLPTNNWIRNMAQR